jgi:hypothetical protein
MGHVRKGCLTRSRSDIRTDGSRIESLHKHINILQRSVASSVNVYFALLCDFIHRQNVRITFNATSYDDKFIVDCAFGSHHLYLADATVAIMNQLNTTQLPIFRKVESNESFGLVTSQHVLNGRFIKEEEFNTSINFDANLESSLQDVQQELENELNLSSSDFIYPASNGVFSIAILQQFPLMKSLE